MTTYLEPDSPDQPTISGAVRFCGHCGRKMAFEAAACPACGRPTGYKTANTDISPKSFGTAVSLCGVFGLLGIHHFYIGNFLHGIIDLGLCLGALTLFVLGNATYNHSLVAIALVLLLVDVAHSIYVFARLITGKQRDGRGLLIPFPGQRV